MSLYIERETYSNVSHFYWPFILHGFKGSGNASLIFEQVIFDIMGRFTSDYQKWVFSILACLLVGLSGIFPLLLFAAEGSVKSAISKFDSHKVVESKLLKRLLFFAVGSLLGDVFLHLLPEAWQSARANGVEEREILRSLGSWVLLGIISFAVCEMLVKCGEEAEKDISENGSLKVSLNNNLEKTDYVEKKESSKKHIAGYLNLLANGFDNFNHGLAVAASFIVSPRMGMLTTGAILVHEIPHEIGDFAILLKSGFNPWSAAKAQLSTATVGLLGAIFTLSVDCMKTMGSLTYWILPYTAGGFINIALTNILPDLLKEDDPKECCNQLASLFIGVAVMAGVTILSE